MSTDVIEHVPSDKPPSLSQIIQLYMAIQSGQPIILVGPAGCGKSTCYKMLAKTLTQLHYGKAAEAREEELVPERSLTFQYSQKLKVCQFVTYLD